MAGAVQVRRGLHARLWVVGTLLAAANVGSQVLINMDGLEWARGKWGAVARWYFRWAEAIAMWTPDRIIADAAAIKANLQSRYRNCHLAT